MSMEQEWNDTDRKGPKYMEKSPFPCVTFHIINTICTGLGLNPAFFGDRTAKHTLPESQHGLKIMKERIGQDSRGCS
jgi:hypothetical protein